MIALALTCAALVAAQDAPVAPVAPVDAAPPVEAAPAVAPAAPAEPAPSAAEPIKRRVIRVAVYALERSGVEENKARVVDDALLAELRKLEGMSVVGSSEIAAMLDHEAQKQMVGCADDTSCVASIADALGVDEIVVGQLTVIGDETLFALRRIDQGEARVKGQYSQRLVQGGGDELLAVIGPAVEQLFPDMPLKKGMERGVGPELALRMNPPPLHVAVFWSTVAAAAVSGTAAAGLGLWFAVNQADYKDVVATSTAETPFPADGLADKQDTLVTSYVAMWIAVGVTAAIGVAAAIEAPLTDWEGYSASNEAVGAPK